MDTSYLEQQIQTIEKAMDIRAKDIETLKSLQDADKKALKAYKESLEKQNQ